MHSRLQSASVQYINSICHTMLDFTWTLLFPSACLASRLADAPVERPNASHRRQWPTTVHGDRLKRFSFKFSMTATLLADVFFAVCMCVYVHRRFRSPSSWRPFSCSLFRLPSPIARSISLVRISICTASYWLASFDAFYLFYSSFLSLSLPLLS